jgi:pyruvate kinase
MLELSATLLPTFPHFNKFVDDPRLDFIRMNSAQLDGEELDKELALAHRFQDITPLYFDIKGRQMRVTKSYPLPDRLELDLNHNISVETPTVVLFKGGLDGCMLDKVVNGNHLVFQGGPEWMVVAGESLHIRHPSLSVHDPLITDIEIKKIEKAIKAGFNKFFLSYVEQQRDIDIVRELIGDSELMLKIENKKGLEFVEKQFKKEDNLFLVAAMGDMYVEVDRPHHILSALKTIIKKDPKAVAGSRMLLSTSQEVVPSAADFMQLAWLYDIGFRRMMLCDEICLKEEYFTMAVGAFDQFRKSYVGERPVKKKRWYSRILNSRS